MQNFKIKFVYGITLRLDTFNNIVFNIIEFISHKQLFSIVFMNGIAPSRVLLASFYLIVLSNFSYKAKTKRKQD